MASGDSLKTVLVLRGFRLASGAFYRNTFGVHKGDLHELFSKFSVFSFLSYGDKHTLSMGNICST